MKYFKKWHVPLACDLKRLAKRPVKILFALLSASIVLHVQTAQALTPRSPTPGATIVVRNDMGGSVRKRYNEIQRINRLGQKVEIRGNICMSSCTMYLGANNVCVSPKTTFGFHGPHRFGARLTTAEFNQWSNVIASHYPTSVRSWYIKSARHQTYNVSRLKGSELIRLGVPKCR